jgi:hypothetical protein
MRSLTKTWIAPPTAPPVGEGIRRGLAGAGGQKFQPAAIDVPGVHRLARPDLALGRDRGGQIRLGAEQHVAFGQGGGEHGEEAEGEARDRPGHGGHGRAAQ